ncbi:hypothetical protein CBM2594_P310039 [Cupriavidus taiwanensis]|uniref:Uncharacterized protein n=1 Tax=Cupriavidus taiwanensis TaxID=164546 RepID=A0A7Z7JID7_9BURK|nr:hypothetical protein CBM2594_P310039 [Cupriavidus taiwanensis]
MSTLGYRIDRAPAPIAIEVVSTLRNVVLSGLSDELARSNSIVGLARFNRTGWFVGTAFTVKCCPGDNLMLYTASNDAAGGPRVGGRWRWQCPARNCRRTHQTSCTEAGLRRLRHRWSHL